VHYQLNARSKDFSITINRYSMGNKQLFKDKYNHHVLLIFFIGYNSDILLLSNKIGQCTSLIQILM
jgi:hypothetical protein